VNGSARVRRADDGTAIHRRSEHWTHDNRDRQWLITQVSYDGEYSVSIK